MEQVMSEQQFETFTISMQAAVVAEWWTRVMPGGITLPAAEQFVRWVRVFGGMATFYAVERTARKVRTKPEMTALEACRYVTSVARRRAEELAGHPAGGQRQLEVRA